MMIQSHLQEIATTFSYGMCFASGFRMHININVHLNRPNSMQRLKSITAQDKMASILLQLTISRNILTWDAMALVKICKLLCM